MSETKMRELLVIQKHFLDNYTEMLMIEKIAELVAIWILVLTVVLSVIK